MMASLRSAGVDVVECHEALWHGIEDRVGAVSGGWLKPKFWLRVVKAYRSLLKKYQEIGDYDVLMVGYPGQFDVFLAHWLCRKSRKPLVWDVLMSLYLISKERNLDQKHAFVVEWIKRIEKQSVRQADLLLIESSHYAEWFHQNYFVPLKSFAYLPLGVDETIFFPERCPKHLESAPGIHILYYGGFLPSHGVGVIIEAARILATTDSIHFELAGEGPEQEGAIRDSEGLANITFSGYLPEEELLDRICRADICLGVFGQTPQSMMTVQNKLFECLSMGKCVISGQSEAVRDLFEDREEIWLCERTGKGLAQAITKLATEPALRKNLANHGASRIKKDYRFQSLGLKLRQELENLTVDGSHQTVLDGEGKQETR